MAPKIRNVAIITKIGSVEAENAAAKVANLLAANNVKTYCVLPLKIGSSTAARADDLKDVKIDLIFAIGGDGTTLRAFRTISTKAPLLSMNIGGHRGIVSEVGVEELDEAIAAILGG